jgi:tricorn protease
MKRSRLLAVLFTLACAVAPFSVFDSPAAFTASAAREARLIRHPHYHQGKVVFSYLGDLWLANENGSGVERLTDHKARDVYPRFSPDGNWVAFSSNRDGNYDVYVMPATGGKPRQLTFHTANDTVAGWSRDSRRILFESSRGQGVFPSVATLWEINADGGMEQPIKTDWGSWGSYSPDGAKLAFTRHPGGWSRKHYRGSYAADLWVMDVAAKKFTKLGDEDYKGNRLWPMYANNGHIYFVSNELPNEKNLKFGGPEVMKSVNNLWKLSDKGGKATQVTHHTDGNLFFPSISADGKTIVYEDNFGVWKLDTASGKSTELHFTINSDSKENEVELVTLNNDLEAFHLSPSNRRAAIAVHGEIFTIATDRGEPQRVSETPWKEQSPRWSPNGKWVAFVSDRSGREEVWISDELGKGQKKLSDADCDKSALVWASDSQALLWSGSDHKLRRVEVESGKEEILAASEAGNVQSAQFSPDGKWLSYAKQDKLLRPHVWVKELATGQERMIDAPALFLQSSGAKWTPDGKKLLLLGGVGAASIASTTGRSTAQLFSVALTPLEKDPTDRDINTEAQAEAAAPPDARGGNRGPAANPQVKIEWDGIERRITQLTRMPGSVSTVVPAPDGRTYLFMAQGGTGEEGGGPAMYTIGEDGSRLTRLNTTVAETGGNAPGPGRGGGGGFGGFAEPQWARDGRSIYFMQGRGLYNLAIAAPTAEAAPTAAAGGRGGGRGGFGAAAPTTTPSTGAAPRRINFTVRMEIDLAAERKQVFNEAWRVMKNRFYDAKMHGVDWAAAKNVYEPMLEHVADTEELQNLIMEMIGELNASHTGISGGGRLPGQTPEERVQTRYPGFDLEADASGYYKVAYVYQKGPADHDYLKLAKGNYILAVNEKPLKTSDNYWKLFNILPGRKFEFLVNSKPELAGAWTVNLEPLNGGAHGTLQYDRWVEDRKQMVAKLTNGEIGYLHIRAMDAPSLAKFQRDLLENQDKKALIIDQRFNGGGGIDQELLQILGQRKAYQVTRGRDSLDVRRPAQAFFGPMVVMQNERSASDAEMFPDGFRALGLGKLVGMPTYGAVIGTGSYTLLDGSAIRTPGSGVFTARGENMENYGVVPDVLVDNGPADFLTGHDRQIEKAIEVLRAQLGTDTKPVKAAAGSSSSR